ncbi:MAG: hypothetical protein WD845_17195 [Pirellulales bacterium]
MRIAVVGASAIVGLVMAAIVAAGGPSVGFAQRPAAPMAGSAGLVTLSTPAGDNRQQVTLIDSGTRTMAVYHIDTTNGEIVLKSVRNLNYDLQMIEFNGTSPLPNEIRALLEQK